MVKLLTRRAAAHSQLLDLPAAAADLTLVCLHAGLLPLSPCGSAQHA